MPDEAAADRARRSADGPTADVADLMLTTGGTGLTPRDVTPEATRAVLEHEAPGIAEALRMAAFPRFPRAALSRGRAGVRGRTLIVNLPGSPGGVSDGLAVLDQSSSTRSIWCAADAARQRDLRVRAMAVPQILITMDDLETAVRAQRRVRGRPGFTTAMVSPLDDARGGDAAGASRPRDPHRRGARAAGARSCAALAREQRDLHPRAARAHRFRAGRAGRPARRHRGAGQAGRAATKPSPPRGG